MSLYALRYTWFRQHGAEHRVLTTTSDKEEADRVVHEHNNGIRLVIGNNGQPLPSLQVLPIAEISDLKFITRAEWREQCLTSTTSADRSST